MGRTCSKLRCKAHNAAPRGSSASVSSDVSCRKSWIRTLLRAPYFVPESKPAISLFHSFRKQRRSIALVGDEYGGVTGLVVLNVIWAVNIALRGIRTGSISQ